MKIDPVRLGRTELQQSQEAAVVSRQSFSRPDIVQPPGEPAPAFQLGQEISAVVVALENDRILLNSGGLLIEADDPGGGLDAGQSLRLRVEMLEPQIVLQVVEQEPTLAVAAAGLLRARLPGLVSPRLTLAGFHDQLASLDVSSFGGRLSARLEKLKHFIADLMHESRAATTDRLMRLVRDGGLQYEAKLLAGLGNPADLAPTAENDLKGLLLGALADFERSALAGEPGRAIAGQLDNIEVQQIVNVLAQLEGDSVSLRIPFFAAGGFTEAALSVERDGTGKNHRGASPHGYTLMFLLELENFGRTRIEAHLNGLDLRVTFYLDRDASVAAVRNELPGFALVLKALGYREVLLSAKPEGMIGAEQRHKFDVLALGLPPNVHLLDVNA